MKKNADSPSKPLVSLIKTPVMLLLLSCVIAVIIMSTGYIIWNGYREQIMNNHKEALLLISRALADNMDATLEEVQSTLDFLCVRNKNAGSFEEASDFYREYLTTRGGIEKDILLIDGSETCSVLGTEIRSRQLVTRVNDEVSISLAFDTEGRHLFLFQKKLSGSQELSLALDADLCYRKWVADVQIGTSGYIMVKNSQGIILMHPEPSQWGIHVIRGREELYPGLDLTSLEAMVNIQNQGNDGILEYYSYWWMETPLVKVHKISGYAPVPLGDDFWVISSVVDYDDYNAPIKSGFFKISMLFSCSLVAIVTMLLFLGSLLIERQRSRQEIATLRALNERLETTHHLEERINHQQRLQIIGTMTGGIAHEFNNLLTPIMGYSELLMMELPEDSDAYDNALEIYDASEKAREVIRQISALSRRNVETVFKKKEALQLLARSCKMMRSICPSDIRLTEEYSLDEETAILCNPTQINQVLLNLCVNAIQAIRTKEEIPKGRNPQGDEPGSGSSGKDFLKEDAPEANSPEDAAPRFEGAIRLIARIVTRTDLAGWQEMKTREIPTEWDKYLLIQVEDNGCGMSPETLRQIFTPFFTTKKTGEGTGLGLTLAEQIIVSHRGWIFADSTPSKGTTFSIFLPVMNTSSQVQDLDMFPAASQATRIVIADDNAKILDMLKKSFDKLSLNVEVCRTRSKLQKLLDAAQTDVLLIDEGLKDCNGIDFCMSIQGLYPRLIKIVLADYPTHTLLEARQRGIIDGYLLKPFSDTDALAEIRKCSTRTV